MINAKEARSHALTDEQFKELDNICIEIDKQAMKRNGIRFITVDGFSTELLWDILHIDLGFTIGNVGTKIKISW